MRYVLALVLLTGCSTLGRTPTMEEWSSLDEARYAWRADLGDKCERNYKHSRIITSDVENYCRAPVAGCLMSSDEPLIVYDGTRVDEPNFVRNLLIHEFAHWANWCSYGNSDRLHKRDATWEWVDCVIADNRSCTNE